VLVGGSFLVIADTVSRIIIAPAEMPVGVLTALIGGPFFLWLLFGKRKNDEEF
jgi:iron complex transport system permease protein